MTQESNRTGKSAPSVRPIAKTPRGGDIGGQPDGSGTRYRPSTQPLALPFGATPLDSEEGREFLQQRLSLFTNVMFVIGGFALVASLLLHLAIPTSVEWVLLEKEGVWWHLLGVGASFAMWLALRKRGVGVMLLFAIDGVGTTLVMGAYALMGWKGAWQAPERASLLIMLVTMCTVTVRAIIVPSTRGHTLAVTALASVPVLLLTYVATSSYPSLTGLPAGVSTAFNGIWVVICLAISAVASQIIYGLRAQVAQAQRLGQYVLDELIGEGGMGVVYKARHALLRRPTAIKLLLPEKAGAQMLRRFEREVQLTAMLTHPNTVNIYDYGHTADGTFYYAMEYLDGINLEQLVQQFGPQDPRRVVHILEQVASSLSEAHSVGLVHRDIKPANVILCNRGGLPDIAKVVDFGLVKDSKELGPGGASLTNANSIIGTPLYLAPEGVIAPDKVDARSDLYALGAIGYYLLTGQPVFTGATMIDVFVQHVNALPIAPSTRLGARVPERLEAFILRCLAKKPVDRPQTAEQFLAELGETQTPRWARDFAATWWSERAEEIARIKPEGHSGEASKEVRDTIIVDFNERAKHARYHLA